MASDPQPIVISIVVVCKDNPEGLRSTLSSLSGRLPDDVQVVIVDGSVSDSCLAMSRALGFDTNHVVEHDVGVYHAMNKGIARSAGLSILFLNSGDRLHPGFLFRHFIDAHRDELGSKVVIGDALYCIKGRKFENTDREYPVQQAMFFPAGFCRERGFDEKLAICADSVFLAAALEKCGHVRVGDIVCEFELGGLSTAPRSLSHIRVLCREMRVIGEIRTRLGEYLWMLRLAVKMALIRAIGLENQFLLHAKFSRRWKEIPSLN